jgi:site-specific DNA recombinase
VFDRNGVTFVSVTQSFNTTTSMGRLTLNILLSFAQFEREVTAERIRDKVKASRMKGMWMGGYVPLGYDVVDRKLVVNEEEAAKVRGVFERFVEVGSATVLARELRNDGFRNKQGTLIDKGYLYRLLNNRVYRGDAVHKGTAYPGEHEAIIEARLWEQVHDILGESHRKRANNSRTQTPALLKGLLFTATGAAMTPSSTKKGTRRYRYYVSMDILKNRDTPEDGIPRRLPADTAEAAVITEICRILRTPNTTAQVIAALDREDIPKTEAIAALQQFAQLWEQLFPAEQARIIQLLVRRVTVSAEGLVIDLRTDGMAGVMRDLMTPRRLEAAE